MVFAVAILVLATTSLEMEIQRSSIYQAAYFDCRARTQLRESLPGLIRMLEKDVIEAAACTALVPSSADSTSPQYQVAYIGTDAGMIPLYSKSNDIESSTEHFISPVSGNRLMAEYQGLGPDKSLPAIELAWAAEDITLDQSLVPAPTLWPLPGWNYSPVIIGSDKEEIPEQIRNTAPDYNSWIAHGEALPFSPGLSPDLVPVVTSLRLRFGIFASGTSGNREKVIRIRFYLEGSIWNPYNRELRMHPGSSLQPAFTLAWHNLPEVRMRNLSKGVQSSWIPLDESRNSQTGATGLSGWIRTPGILEAGQQYAFSEPDAKYQPEGLARIIHPAFMVGPADHIILELRNNGSGSVAACLMLDTSNPLKDAAAGKGWFSFKNFRIDLPEIDYDRADDLPAPFYLHGGSLDFRREHCQYVVDLVRPESSLNELTDPRRRSLKVGASHVDAGGNIIKEETLFGVEAVASSDQKDPNLQTYLEPLFSWPSRKPVSIIEYTDYSNWENAFRLGSRDSNEINKFLNDAVAPPIGGSRETVKLLSTNGSELLFNRSFPVNHRSEKGWALLIQQSVQDSPPVVQRYPTPSAGNPDHFKQVSIEELNRLGKRIATAIQTQPSISVADFFNRGLLSESTNSSLDELLPMRGYLRNSDPLTPHGSAWILHLSVRVSQDELRITRQARAWLQKVIDKNKMLLLELIRFEWVES